MGSRSRPASMPSLLISRRRHQIRIKSEIFVGWYSFLGTHFHLILFRPLCPVAIPLTSTNNSPAWRDPANLSLNMPAPTDILTLASNPNHVVGVVFRFPDNDQCGLPTRIQGCHAIQPPSQTSLTETSYPLTSSPTTPTNQPKTPNLRLRNNGKAIPFQFHARQSSTTYRAYSRLPFAGVGAF